MDGIVDYDKEIGYEKFISNAHWVDDGWFWYNIIKKKPEYWIRLKRNEKLKQLGI